MARRNRNTTVNEEEVELDEVDSFNANREKILLDEAGEYGRDDQSEDDDSEEEVMQVEEDSEDDEDDQENSGYNDDEEDEEEEDEEEVEEEEGKGWGGRQNYYGGDDVSDDEDAKQMTEEALRQQKKHLQELAMDDYLDEEMMEDWQKKADSYDNKESLSTTQQSQQQLIIESNSSIENLEDNDKLKLLQQSFPEFIPLLKELNILKVKLEDLQKIEDKNRSIETKIVALSAYLGAISSYFAIFVDNLNNEESFVSMKDNPIMETILSSREIWRQANELPDEIKMDDVKVYVSDVVSSDIDDEENFVDAKEEQSEDEEISEIEEEEEEEEEQEEEEKENQSDDLDIDANSQRIIKHVSKRHGDDFTEADIEDIDMEDKQRRKKTLRFYTSKIDKAAAKKDQSYSGDMDVPYKERLFERQQRLLEEARKRGLQKQDDENISDNINDDDDNDNDNDEGFEQNDNYYQSVKQHKLNKKQSRKSAHEAAIKAAKEGKLAELQESVGQDGKRAINYQILKNKGLTPHRKKEYRNSRVKKRKQYEKAQKKLKSVRQVYDANNRGPYEGEKTGIKKGLSRSVKLV
ncbi:Something About Silencing ortholgue, putative [Candida dubliniensis CD36]|uniref:Something About Silencing ortholgue, putative n=1 Tax=Candida dubliniensis (strain CD36 / ATCC MYA-646 / CBS 7987 / NCPF 3949 / NRRL Y-17841) TaxID=573826 RepID=B9WFX6_CANDC|nr:SSU processome component SAS10 [Candida dubliniensis CD36]CAX42145.1 Something About Silencing ortholgue, putative [Candida dubliniensis CD36]